MRPNIVARWRAGNPPEVNFGFFGPSDTAQEYMRAGQLYDLTPAMNKPMRRLRLREEDEVEGHAAPGRQAVDHRERQVLGRAERDHGDQLLLQPCDFSRSTTSRAPKTWAQFLHVCAVLKKNGVAPLTVTGTFAGYMQLYYDYLLARRVGADPARRSGRRQEDVLLDPGHGGRCHRPAEPREEGLLPERVRRHGLHGRAAQLLPGQGRR